MEISFTNEPSFFSCVHKSIILSDSCLNNMQDLSPPSGTGQNGRIAMIAGGSYERDTKLASLATLAGCTPLPMEDTQPADFLLIDLSSETDILSDTISRLTHYLQTHHSTALIWSKMETLELVYAAFPHGQCHFLVNADDVEAMPILVGAFGRIRMDRLQERDQDVEFRSLHRISDELAEFARTLARMADSEPKDKIRDKSTGFRAAPLGGFQEFPGENSVANDATPKLSLREIIKLRRLREQFFPPDLFADPSWDILLDLKAAAQEGQRVSVSSLCIAAAVPPTTALRWISAMTESGMLLRRQDPADARRVFIELSPETSAKMDDFIVAVSTRSAPII